MLCKREILFLWKYGNPVNHKLFRYYQSPPPHYTPDLVNHKNIYFLSKTFSFLLFALTISSLTSVRLRKFTSYSFLPLPFVSFLYYSQSFFTHPFFFSPPTLGPESSALTARPFRKREHRETAWWSWPAPFVLDLNQGQIKRPWEVTSLVDYTRKPKDSRWVRWCIRNATAKPTSTQNGEFGRFRYDVAGNKGGNEPEVVGNGSAIYGNLSAIYGNGSAICGDLSTICGNRSVAIGEFAFDRAHEWCGT